MTSALDINIARLAHLNLESTLESMRHTEQPEISQQGLLLPSPKTCELGQWLSSRRLQSSAWDDTFYQLIPIHAQFHQTAENMTANLELPANERLQSTLRADKIRLRSLSREIVYLLTSAELQFMNGHNKHVRVAHPLKSLLRRFMGRYYRLLAWNEDLLDVSHERLVHLQWSKKMLQAFRNRGRDSTLDSVNSCSLGNWIYTVGLQRHKEIEEITTLNHLHHAFHDRAKETIRALRRRQDNRAEQAYTAMQEHSHDIIYLLSIIESKLLSEASIHRTESFVR